MFKDLTGLQFERLTVINKSYKRSKNRQIYWNCVCSCGTLRCVRADQLTRGIAQSCGCKQREFAVLLGKSRLKHGKRNSKEYGIWCSIKARCFNTNNHAYKNYGGRGISMCRRWLNFNNFLKDMGKCPVGYSIDRIDVNGNYTAENCRWATPKEQSRNTRFNVLITHNGKSQCIAAWAEELNIPYKLLYQRIRRGLTIEETLTTPVRKRRNRTNE
jgi:hypothetical protein